MLKTIFGSSNKRDYMSPALNFEALTGITGVGRVYNMPGGLSMEQMESFLPLFSQNYQGERIGHKLTFRWKLAQMGISDLLDSDRALYSKLADKFCDLNPELKAVNFNPHDAQACRDFCLGVTSGFNPSDIQYYLSEDKSTPEAGRVAYEKRLHGYIGQLSHRLDSLSGIMGTAAFIPSPETTQHINAELDRRYGPDPVASMPEDKKKEFLEAENRKKYEGPPPTFWQRTFSMLR